MVALRPDYCQLGDVTKRLYSGQGTPTVDTGRDDLLNDLISALSRRFDQETGRPPGGFAPLYDVRVFSGRGAQMLLTDEFAAISTVKYNTTPGQTPTWLDVSGDFTTGGMVVLPMRYWPKQQIQRINSFVVDPYRTGNVQLAGIWGAVQPDMSQSPPTPTWQGLTTQPAINALSPDGNGGGWWITPEDVTKAVAEWVVYTWKAGQAAYGDTAGNPSGGPLTYRKGIPPEVQMVIDAYSQKDLKLAMIASDGTDIADAAVYGNASASPFGVSRWADWQAVDLPPGGH